MAKLTKLYMTQPHGFPPYFFNQCLWCDESYLFHGIAGYDIMELGTLILTVYKINPDGSLLQTYQMTNFIEGLDYAFIRSLYYDGKFLYVGIAHSNPYNSIMVYELEVDGTLTYKSTKLIDQTIYGYISCIKGDGKFIYVTTAPTIYETWL
jgi:hypothetical protein